MDDFDSLNIELEKQRQLYNNSPIEDFDGYSPFEMNLILSKPFDKNSPLQLRHLNPKTLDSIPILQQVILLCEILLREKKLKLTKQGFLPVKIVKELYNSRIILDYSIETKLSTLSREFDCLPVHLTVIICNLTSIFRKSKGHLILTKKGQNLLDDQNAMFTIIFTTLFQKFNWSYFDGYESEKYSQVGAIFSLMLISKYGNTSRKIEFYAEKYRRAFSFLEADFQSSKYSTPIEQMKNCYTIRTFQRMLNFFGVIEPNLLSYDSNTLIKKNDQFDLIFSVNQHKNF